METPPPNNNLQTDLTGIKNFFKKTVQTVRALAKGASEQTQKQETNNTLTSIKNFVTKHATLSFLILLLVLQFMPNLGFLPWGGIHLRLQADDILLSDKISSKIVYDSFYNKFYAALTQQQPNLPETTKEDIVRRNLNAIIDTDPKIQQERQKVANAIQKEYQYTTKGKTYTYMPDIDPYRYLRLANNVLTKGHTGDTIKEGIPWDKHATAPIGSNISIELHPYTLAAIHKTINIFESDTPLMQTAAYFPIIATILTLIILFFIGTTLTNPIGGFITATLFSFNYAIFIKTAFGMADTDAYNILFPATFMYFFLKAFTNPQKKLLSIITASTILGLYAFTWAGWWYTLYIAIATITITVAYQLFTTIKNKTFEFKLALRFIITTLVFLLISMLILTYILSYKQYAQFDFEKGFESLKIQIKGPFSFSKINTATRDDLWPNVYTSVAELSTPNLNKIISFSGGALFLILACIGVFLLINERKPTSTTFIYGIFLTLTLFAAIYASFKGQRFIILIIPPAAITAGYAIMRVYAKITQNTTSKITHTFGIVFLFFTLVILTNGQQTQIQYWLENATPHVNDAWWNALTQIKENSQKDAIITSWWDFGHQFAYISDRAVTFDGGSQNTPMAHWVGKLLSTSNEEEAIGILRMLSCGSNKAYDVLTEKYNYNLFEAHEILNNLFLTNKKEEAKKYLDKQKINNPEDILQYTHCNPPENYFITSEDMREKAGVWSHFGNWDFKKAYIWQTLKNKPEEEAINIMTNNLSYTKEDAQALYERAQTILDDTEAQQWISTPWMYENIQTKCKSTQNTLFCGDSLTFNLETGEANRKEPEGLTPIKKAVYVNEKNNEFTETTATKNAIDKGAIVFKSETGDYYVLGAMPQLVSSMFTRLMYFDAHGLKHFKPFAKEKQIDGGFVSVWKIDWNGTTPNIAPTYQHKE
ncbi:hypothetical protein HY485_02855, partial [Candidatus Woesearchaeota archaeon]|nr:hypothetical protein [Candidatus Woesearchaeota archaeon]